MAYGTPTPIRPYWRTFSTPYGVLTLAIRIEQGELKFVQSLEEEFPRPGISSAVSVWPGTDCTGLYDLFASATEIEAGDIALRLAREASRTAGLASVDADAGMCRETTQVSAPPETLPAVDDPVYLYEPGRGWWVGTRAILDSARPGDWLWTNCHGTQHMHANGTWSCTTAAADDNYQPTHFMPLPKLAGLPLSFD